MRTLAPPNAASALRAASAQASHAALVAHSVKAVTHSVKAVTHSVKAVVRALVLVVKRGPSRGAGGAQGERGRGRQATPERKVKVWGPQGVKEL